MNNAHPAFFVKKSSCFLLLILACCMPNTHAKSDETDNLTIEQIYKDEEFKPNDFGPVRWLKDNTGYTTLEPSEKFEEAKDIIRHNPQMDKRSILVSAEQLIPQNATEPLEIEDYAWSDDGKKLLVYTNAKRVWRENTRGDYWVLTIDNGSLIKIGGDADESKLMFAKFSPDGSQVAYVYYNNIYIQRLSDMKIHQITKDGSDIIINGTSDWVYEEEFDLRDGFRWSPDGRFIAYWQFDTSDVKEFKLINYIDGLYPTITSYKYPKVGQTNSACRLGVISAKGGRTSWIDLPGDLRNNYIPKMQWIPESSTVMFQRLNRLQNTNEVIITEVKANYLGQAKTSPAETFFVDKDEAWVEVNANICWLEGNKYFTWISEMDGWRHLYLIDRKNGQARLLTHGEYDVVEVLSINEEKNTVYFVASLENATQQYLYKIGLNGKSAPKQISPQWLPGTHKYQISDDAEWAIHTYSAMGKAPVVAVVSLPDHKQIRLLEDNAELQKRIDALPGDKGEFFKVDIGDGIVLDAWSIKPPDFDPLKKYPLIFYVYGEPAGQTVLDRWGDKRYLYHRFLAQQGYIIISVDNRGTPAPKGRHWRKCIYEKIGILATKEQALAAEKILSLNTYIDRERVGIWGWSGGGSMTLNMMFRHPEIYKTGIAIAFSANQLYYDTIYQERYMGLPDHNKEGYTNGSPITFAHQLEGNLLIIHGTADDNVHYQNFLALIDKLVKHDKMFSTMIYPNCNHGLKTKDGDVLNHLFNTMASYLFKNMPPVVQ